MNDKTNDPVPNFDGEPDRLDKSRLPSRHTTVGPERAPHRSFLYAMGLSSQEIAQPFVGVVTTWNEAAPCNITLSRQAQAAKRGVTAAGGTPREFTTITVTDGIAMGHAGMKASLVSREVIADSVELSVRGHCYDALVGLAGCDKTLPGLMMAMLRLNVPSVFLYGGSILPGRFRGKDVTVLDVFEAVGAHAAGTISDADLAELETVACPSAGSCGGQYTANSMAYVSEGYCQSKFDDARQRRNLAAMTQPKSPFRYFNSSPEIIRLVVMMYVKYPLSLRNVEDLLAERGIDICHETVRFWWNRFGPMFAAEIRRKRVDRMRAFTHWRWHLDEVFVKINGQTHYLWRAIDHEGEVLESYVTKTRDKSAALNFIKKAMKRHRSPEVIVTDGLKSYSAALREIGALEKRVKGRRLNNRVENSHLPFRRRERAMLRFRRMKTLQKFASVHGSVHNHFNQDRHLNTRQNYKDLRSAALVEWKSLMA